jgi:hypothetical protein
MIKFIIFVLQYADFLVSCYCLWSLLKMYIEVLPNMHVVASTEYHFIMDMGYKKELVSLIQYSIV